jgi:hypothetical protein
MGETGSRRYQQRSHGNALPCVSARFLVEVLRWGFIG